jgi:hypothetical protein
MIGFRRICNTLAFVLASYLAYSTFGFIRCMDIGGYIGISIQSLVYRTIAKGFSNSCLLSSFLLSLRILNLLIIKFKGHRDSLVLCLILSKLQFHRLSFLLLYFLGSWIS